MKKFVALSLLAPAFLGLAACGGTVTNNSSEDVVANVDDANLTVDDNAVIANDTVPTENSANAQ